MQLQKPSGTGVAPYGFKIYDADHKENVVALRDAVGEQDFEAAWAEGAALSDTASSSTYRY